MPSAMLYFEHDQIGEQPSLVISCDTYIELRIAILRALTEAEMLDYHTRRDGNGNTQADLDVIAAAAQRIHRSNNGG